MFKGKRKLIIIAVVILLVVLAIIALSIYNQSRRKKFVEAETQRVLQYSKIEDFKNIDEVCMYLDTELISQTESKEDNVDYEIKVNLKYNAELDKKSYYENLIQYSAYALQYKNFYIIDEKKNINIFVFCNPDKSMVVTYYINGEEKFFEKQGALKEVHEFKNANVTNLNVKSELLKQILNNNWSTNKLDIGTVDSQYKNYEIYFDEGFEIKKVNGKIFNMVFTDKYESEIIENVKVGISKQDTEDLIGRLTFDAGNVWGYKTEEFYIFFSKEQISVYPVIKYDTGKIIDIVENYEGDGDFQKLINDIRSTWQDYDLFESTGNKTIIRYTLKGITFRYCTTANNGIVIYNNYTGNVNKTQNVSEMIESNDVKPLNDMYFENANSVFEYEKARVATTDDYSSAGNETKSDILNISKKYKIVKGSDGKLMFISIGRQMPNTELRESIYNGIWYDDNNFIYSVEGRGIYMYNVDNQTYRPIIEGKDEYKIYSISKEKVLYFDNDKIAINI